MLSIISLMEKKYQKKRCASAHVPRFSHLVKPFNQICWVNCPFDLWKGHILTPCCFKWPLTPGCNLMECMPTTEKGQQVTRVTLNGPRGKRPLDTGPSASVAAETHKCCSSRLSRSSAGCGDGCEPKKRWSLFENEAWNTYLYCICIKRGCFFCKRDACKICACVHGHVHAHVWACECACVRFIYTTSEKVKANFFFSPCPAIFYSRIWKMSSSIKRRTLSSLSILFGMKDWELYITFSTLGGRI